MAVGGGCNAWPGRGAGGGLITAADGGARDCGGLGDGLEAADGGREVDIAGGSGGSGDAARRDSGGERGFAGGEATGGEGRGEGGGGSAATGGESGGEDDVPRGISRESEGGGLQS